MKEQTSAPIHGQELKSVAKGAGIAFVGRGIGTGLQYLYMILIARFLGTERLGLYLLGLTLTNIAGVVAKLGLDKGILRFVALYGGEADFARMKGILLYALRVAGSLSVLIGAGIFACATVLADFFKKPDLVPVLHIFSLSLPFYILFTLSLVAMQAIHAMKFNVALQHLFLPLCTMFMTWLFVLSGAQLWGVLAGYSLSLVVATLLAFYLLRRIFPAFTKKEMRPIYEGDTLMRYSMPLMLAMFLNFSLLWTDTLMLGYYRTSSEVGIYNLAVKTALLPNLILVAFNAIFTPIMSDLFNRGEIKKVEGLFKTVTRWIFLMSFPYTLIVALLSKEIMGIFGLEFTVGWVSLILLVCSQLISAGTGPVIEILSMSGKQMVMLYNEVGAVVLNVLLNVLLIPPFGITGAAIATGIAWATLNVMSLVQVHRRYRIHPYERACFKPLLAGLVAFCLLFQVKALLRWAQLPKFPTMFAVSGLFLVVYIGLLWRMGLSSDDHFILDKFRGRFFSRPSASTLRSMPASIEES